MNSETNTKHSLGIIPISLSKILERFSYYGMRAILVLYLVRQLELPTTKASSIYGIFLLIVGLMPLFGGLIGDLLTGSKLATIIGGFVQGAGYFLLAVPNQLALYAGLFLIAIGCGLYNPNSLSMISSIYQNRSEKMDAAVTIVYTCVNIGALVSQFLIFLAIGRSGYQLGFIFCGIAVVCSQLILIFLRHLLNAVPNTPNIYLSEAPKEIKTDLRVIVIIATIIFISLFWMIYEIAGFNIFTLSNKIQESFHWFENVSLMIPSIATVFLGIVLSIVWYFAKISSYLKIATGLLIYALACIIISAVYQNSVSTGLVSFAIIFIFLESVSEMLIVPIALSIICKYASTRFNATVIAGYLCLTSVIYYLTSFVMTQTDKLGPSITFVICAVILTIISILFLIFYFLTRKRNGTANVNSSLTN